MKAHSNLLSKLILGLFVLTLVSGCDFLKKKTEGSSADQKTEATEKKGEDSVLLKIDGDVVLKESDYNKRLNQMLQVNPYLRGATADKLPMPLKQRFFEELKRQEMILAWAKKNNVEKREDFKKNLEETLDLVKRSLLVQSYENDIFKNIKVEEPELKDFYEKNKARFIKEGTGGVAVSGISFTDAVKANEFMSKVKGKDFAAMASKETAGKFKNFGRITKETSPVECPPVIKNRVLTAKPGIEKVVEGKNIWVLNVSDKKEAEFEKLDDHKAQIENVIKSNKFREILEKNLKDLEKEFKVEETSPFAKGENPTAQAEGPEVAEEETPATAA